MSWKLRFAVAGGRSGTATPEKAPVPGATPQTGRCRRAVIAALGLLSLLGMAVESSAYPLRFPAHGEDLPFGHYWKASGIHTGSGMAHDFGGKRYDFGAGAWHNSVSSGNKLETSIVFDLPVYAGADGVVVGCWRQYPDWTGANQQPQNSHRQTVIGNHLEILTDDGYLVSYGHFKQNSISTKLCPNSSADGWLDSVGEGESRPMTGDMIDQYLVPEHLRFRVKTGQVLGRVGNSGWSTGPHLHVQVLPVTVANDGTIFKGDLEPIQFTGALYQDADSPSYNDWAAFNNTEINPLHNSLGEIVIWPDESRKVSVSSRGTNHLDIFDVGPDRRLRQKIWNGSGWSGWIDQGGTLTSSPACTSWAFNRVDCFARGQNLAMYHKYWTSAGGWSSWSSKGGILASAPTVTSRGVNHLDVFIRGTDNQLYQKIWTGAGWTGWIAKGGTLHSSPACVSSAGNRLDCFARGTNRHLIQKSWNNVSGWTGWSDRGGILTSAPSVSSRTSGDLDVFIRGGDRQLYFKHFNGANWGSWSAKGGVLTSAPASTSWSSNRIDIFALGSGRDVYQKVWVPSVWFLWNNIED